MMCEDKGRGSLAAPRPPRKPSALLLRVASALVLAPLLLLVVAVGGLWYVGAVMAAVLLASWELYRLLQRAGYAPLWPFGLFLGLAFVLDAAAPLLPLDSAPGRIIFPALALSLTLSLIYLVARQRVQGSLADWAVTWVPPLYVGFLLAFAVPLRLMPSGDRWVYLVLGITWATDIGAYFVGSAVGRRRFFPQVSPRKSLEGAVGGLVAGMLAGGLLAWLFGWGLWHLLGLALIASMAAQAGDLAESLMKRLLRTKDTSRLIPGHGGLLDRLDSLLFVVTVTYFWAVWVGGAG